MPQSCTHVPYITTILLCSLTPPANEDLDALHLLKRACLSNWRASCAKSLRLYFSIRSIHRLIDCTWMFGGIVDGASVYPLEVVKEARQLYDN